MNPATWAGSLTVTPGAQLGAVQLQRPDVATHLLQGCLASAVPARVSAVFTLCAQVQAHTARQALAAAAGNGDAAPASTAVADPALAVATAREHVLRITQDWPAVFASVLNIGALPATAPDALPACPLWQARLDDHERLTQLGPWLGRHLLGCPPQAWLDGYLADPAHWAARWCRTTGTAAAAALQAVHALAQGLATPQRAWGWPTGTDASLDTARTLAHLIDTQAQFSTRPTWHGAARDTGPWRRCHGQVPADADATVWGRLTSRLADLAWLACPAGPGMHTPARLVHGSATTGPLQGLAWTEMARGLLVHWVQLADSPEGLRVTRYRVIAPTEWNCHPAGGLAQCVAALAPDNAAAARLLALAYDPCVPVQIQQLGAGVVHA